MPGTHLLPPNLLKLFAPRPPLPYQRPVGKDIDRVRSKDVAGVADILARLKEQSTATLLSGEGDAMEEGEEPTFTLAEETKRQIKREERKKKKTEEFKIAKETCQYFLRGNLFVHLSHCPRQASRRFRSYWRSIQDTFHLPLSKSLFDAMLPYSDFSSAAQKCDGERSTARI